MINRKIVLVEWVDSTQPISAWVHISEDYLNSVLDNICIMKSVGFVLKEDDSCMILCQGYGIETINSPEQANGIAVIPKCSIKSIVVLKEEGIDNTELYKIKNYDNK